MASYITSGVPYILLNKNSGTAADFNQSDMRTLVGWSAGIQGNQQWIFEEAGNGGGSGLYFIKSVRGPYITYEGTPQTRTPLLVTQNKVAWKVGTDTVDSSAIRIICGADENLVIDLSAGASANGTKIILHPKNDGRNQAWGIKAAPPILPSSNPEFPTVFTLTGVQTGCTLTVNSDKTVTGGPKTGNVNQSWFAQKIVPSDDSYVLWSAAGPALSVDGNAETYKKVGASSLEIQWSIRGDPKDSSIVQIFYPGTDLALDVDGGHFGNAVPIILYPGDKKAPGLNQQYRIEDAS